MIYRGECNRYEIDFGSGKLEMAAGWRSSSIECVSFLLINIYLCEDWSSSRTCVYIHVHQEKQKANNVIVDWLINIFHFKHSLRNEMVERNYCKYCKCWTQGDKVVSD